MHAQRPETAASLIARTFAVSWLHAPPDDPSLAAQAVLNKALPVPGKADRRIVSGTLLLGEGRGIINVENRPVRDLPSGYRWISTKDHRVTVGEVLADPPQGRFLLLILDKQRVMVDRLRFSGAGIFVVNDPRGPRWAARRNVLQRLITTRQKPEKLRDIRRLLEERLVAEDVATVDVRLAALTDNTALLDLVEVATDAEFEALRELASMERRRKFSAKVAA